MNQFLFEWICQGVYELFVKKGDSGKTRTKNVWKYKINECVVLVSDRDEDHYNDSLNMAIFTHLFQQWNCFFYYHEWQDEGFKQPAYTFQPNRGCYLKNRDYNKLT